MNLKHKKVFIAGSGGMVGRAVSRKLESQNYHRLIYQNSQELNLIRQSEVERFFLREKPEIVILAAARVGGILANNNFRAEFIYQNLMIEANCIQAAFENQVEKLIFLGSSCIYPRDAPQPLKEEALLSGNLEPTNEPYAIAKIAGIKLCENYYRQYGANFFSVMPTNLYGINDNFELQNSHVIPALFRKFHEAKIKKEKNVVVWGTGRARREFLYVDDVAEAICFMLENVEAKEIYDEGVPHINIGTGEDIAIKDLAGLIKNIVGFEGEVEYDTTKPGGTPRKLLDNSRLKKMGWNHQTPLEEGLRKTYDWYLQNKSRAE